MVLTSPKDMQKNTWKEFLSLVEQDNALLDLVNEEVKLFYEFCLKNNDRGISRLGCSFSKSFYKTKSGKNVSGLKYCFVSPLTDFDTIKNEVNKLKEQFIRFRILKNK